MRSQQGAPKRSFVPFQSVSTYYHAKTIKNPTFVGSLPYLFKKRAIVALFALSSEFNSNCLKPNFCSTIRTIASLVISTFFPFFAFSILFSLFYINYYTDISERVNRYFKLNENTYPQVIHITRRRFYHTLEILSRENSIIFN